MLLIEVGVLKGNIGGVFGMFGSVGLVFCS